MCLWHAESYSLSPSPKRMTVGHSLWSRRFYLTNRVLRYLFWAWHFLRVLYDWLRWLSFVPVMRNNESSYFNLRCTTFYTLYRSRRYTRIYAIRIVFFKASLTDFKILLSFSDIHMVRLYMNFTVLDGKRGHIEAAGKMATHLTK